MKALFLTLILLFAAAPAHSGELGDLLKEKINAKLKKDQPQTNEAPAQTQTPALGKISDEDEIALGREIAGNLLGAAPLINDVQLQKYVNKIGKWVALQSERPDLPWTFGVIESNDINAFAAPGGYVFVTRGLYRLLNDESELAGVLAHEISHVVKKHHLKIMQKSALIDLGSELLSKKLAKNGHSANRLIGSGAEIMSRSLDKDAEFEADRMGIVLATGAGYEPWGLPTVLQEIGNVGAQDSSVALLFKTHPLPDERLAKLDESLGNKLDGIKGGKTLSTRLYKLKN